MQRSTPRSGARSSWLYTVCLQGAVCIALKTTASLCVRPTPEMVVFHVDGEMYREIKE